MQHSFHRALVALVLGLALAALLPGPRALADAPGTRGDDDLGQGGTAQQRAGAGSALWHGVQPLEPLDARSASVSPRLAPALSEAEGASALPWLTRELNPGNWVLDAGMGIISAIFASLAELLQASAMSMMPGSMAKASPLASSAGWSILPAGCDDAAAYNIVFCTPARLTYAHPNIARIWTVMRPTAIGLVTVLFVFRLFRLMLEGQVSLQTEGKSLLVSFLGASLFISQSQWVLGLIVDLFNAISDALLACAGGASNVCATPPLPAASPDGTLNAGAAVMYIAFWLVVLILVIKGFLRVVYITVLIGVAPLAGAMLIDRSTAPRFRAWLDKLLDLLFEQVALVIVFICAAALLQPLQAAAGANTAQQGWDSLVNFLFGTITLLMTIFGGPAVIGIAKAAPASYLQSRLQMAGMRALGAGGTATGRALGGRALAGLAEAAEGAGQTRMAGRLSQAAARVRGTHALGDPRQSAAAGREGSGGATGSPARARSSPGRVARELRTRAGHSDLAAAARMRQRADVLAQYDRTGQIARPPGRYGMRLANGSYQPNAAGMARRSAIRRAATVADGLVDQERAGAKRRVAADAARLDRLRDAIAASEVAQTAPDGVRRLQDRYASVASRVERGRARLTATDPATEAGRALRRGVALAVADRELPPSARRNRPEDAAALAAARRGAARALGQRPGMLAARVTPEQAARRHAERGRRIAMRAEAGGPEQAALRQRAATHDRQNSLAARAVKLPDVARRQRRPSPLVAGSAFSAQVQPPRAARADRAARPRVRRSVAGRIRPADDREVVQ